MKTNYKTKKKKYNNKHNDNNIMLLNIYDIYNSEDFYSSSWNFRAIKKNDYPNNLEYEILKKESRDVFEKRMNSFSLLESDEKNFVKLSNKVKLEKRKSWIYEKITIFLIVLLSS